MIGELTNEIQVLVNSWDLFAKVVHIAVDASSKRRKSSKEVDAILVRMRPVLRFLYALLIGGLEAAVMVQCCHANAKLGHGVQSLGEPIHMQQKSARTRSGYSQLTSQ